VSGWEQSTAAPQVEIIHDITVRDHNSRHQSNMDVIELAALEFDPRADEGRQCRPAPIRRQSIRNRLKKAKPVLDAIT